MSSNNRHWEFFIITYLWSWTLLAIPILFGIGYEKTITKIIFFAAGIAPSATGIILALTLHDKHYWKDFCNRILNTRLISWKWYLIIFIIIPLTSSTAILINYLLTNNMPEFSMLQKFYRNPAQIIPFALYMFLFGPIAEEIGWRGYALDQLEKKFNWVTSSLILGFFWSLWHLPMFFIKGTYQYGLLNTSFFLFIDFYAAIFAMSIIMDWIYNNSKRSILSGILVHFCINFFGELLELPGNIMYLRTAFQIAVAILILGCYRKFNTSSLEQNLRG